MQGQKKAWVLVACTMALICGAYIFLTREIKPTPTEEGGFEVGVTVFPLYVIAREIGGAEMDARLIVPAGASPHTFEVTPGLLKELRGASLIFSIGYGVDDWIGKVGASLPSARIISVDCGITLRVLDEDGVHIDPHYWLDPMNGVHIAETMAQEFSERDPEHLALYAERARIFGNRIRARDAEWQKSLAVLKNKNILTFHDAYVYFADHFGLTVAGAFEPFPGKEPTPQYLAGLASKVKEYGLEEVFLEPQFSAVTIEAFAKDYGLRVGILDAEGRGDANVQTYDDLIDYNVRTIVETKNASR